jgi:hypothetical protein
MPGRYQTGTRNLLYKLLCIRDGELCLRCKAEHGLTRKPPKTKLDIDHIDGNFLHADPDNLGLLCNPCNNHMRRLCPADHKKKMLEYRATVLLVCEREKMGGSTEVTKCLVDYNQGSAEMKASNYLEGKYREYVLNIIKARGSFPTKEAINSGAEHVGFSSVTARRYLEKLMSEAGPLAEINDSTKRNILVFKELPEDAVPENIKKEDKLGK